MPMPTFKQKGMISFLIGLNDLDVPRASDLIDKLMEAKNKPIGDKLEILKLALEGAGTNTIVTPAPKNQEITTILDA
tara:strand:- start:162 stop:392 length:231 start_codon:yes stop_codon:yes gene_type:complete